MPMNPVRIPVRPGAVVTGNRFRLGAKSYGLAACVCLYRFEAGAQSLAEFLVLTPDMRFAHVARPQIKAGEDIDIRAYAAIELNAGEARDFLLAHGEGDMVDDFPDLFSIVQRAGRLVEDSVGTSSNRHPAHNTAH